MSSSSFDGKSSQIPRRRGSSWDPQSVSRSSNRAGRVRDTSDFGGGLRQQLGQKQPGNNNPLRRVSISETKNNDDKFRTLSSIVPSSRASRRQMEETEAPQATEDANDSAAAPPTSTDNDLNIVELFGPSVEVDDDKCRTIHLENKELKQSNEKTKSAITGELETEKQLQMDLGHTLREMQSLSKGAADQLEIAQTHRTIADELKQEFELNIVKPTMTAERDPSMPQPVTPEDKKRVDANESKEQEMPSENTNQTILLVQTKKADRLFKQFRQYSRETEEADAAVKDYVKKRKLLEESMEEQGLQQSLERTKSDAQKLQMEVKKDNEYLEALSVSISQSRDSCANLAQELVHSTKQLNELKDTNRDAEEQRKQQWQEILKKEDELEEDKKNMTALIDQFQEKTRICKEQMKSYQAFCDNRQNHQISMNEKAKKKEELLAQKAELQRKLDAALSRKKESSKQLNKAKEEKEAAEKVRQANDKTFENVVAPGKEEMAQLALRKIELSAKIQEAQQNLETARNAEERRAAEKEESRKKLAQEFDQLQSDLNTAQKESKEKEEEREKFKKDVEEKVESYATLEAKFVNDADAERKNLKVKKLNLRAKMEDKLKDQLQLKQETKRYHHKLVRAGAALIEEEKKRAKNFPKA